MTYKSKEANDLMFQYGENGIRFILTHYTIDRIAAMILPDETFANNVKLSKLLLYIQQAQAFHQALSEAIADWDADEWEQKDDEEELLPGENNLQRAIRLNTPKF